jgi:hypothetical protein
MCVNITAESCKEVLLFSVLMILLIFESCYVQNVKESTVNHSNLRIFMKLKFIKLHVSAVL